MNKLYLNLIFLFAIFSIQAQTYNILPLGNSVTQGTESTYSYRYPLWQKLIDENVDFNFVGSLSDNFGGTPIFPMYNGQTFDQDHEGHWGWRCDEILDQLPNWLPLYTSDVVLIHLGTNDLYQGNGDPENIAQTISELEDIILVLRSNNPNVIVLLATLIPSTNPLLLDKIPLLNEEMPQISIDLDDPNSPILIVDQFDGFDAALDTYDGVHPNETGEDKMALKWRDAILSVMNTNGGLHVNLKVFLEGPYNGSLMNNLLNNYLPLSQPFNTSPWNYQGIESVTSIPANVVSWVLVEFRDATDVNSAIPSAIIDRKACFLLTNGQIIDMSGNQDIEINFSVLHGLYAVVHHRNHLSIISSNPLPEVSGLYSYDFTEAINSALGGAAAQTQFSNGKFGMIAGDFNSDGIINEIDYQDYWVQGSGTNGYNVADSNMDSQVNNKDKNESWIVNFGKTSFVPE
ncbi:MAG: SGNH/GDSL hydrolase family protein [Bacteroidales bacterium]|nr:SGNH/GDSL hydrolase family protein [Bacteroidales bacterium]MCF8405927.1 SGNH/GDSL hydrolase family protein [Bacteroidales bacterium]